jgi:hypothetical protein
MTKVELEYLDIFKNRHGRERCYFRYRGKRWPLPLPTDHGFASTYEARLKAVADGQIEIGNVAFIQGSLGWAIDQFLDSTEWRDRAQMTRKNQRPIFDHPSQEVWRWDA